MLFGPMADAASASARSARSLGPSAFSAAACCTSARKVSRRLCRSPPRGGGNLRDRSRMRLMSWTCSSIESKRCRCSRSEACWWRRRARLISRCPANAGTMCSSRPGMMLCSRRRSQVNDRGQERWASRRRLACSSSSWRSARRRACSSMSIIPGESSSSMCSLCWGTLPAQGAQGKTADLNVSTDTR